MSVMKEQAGRMAVQAQNAAAAAAQQRAEADARLEEVTAALEGERTHAAGLKVRC